MRYGKPSLVLVLLSFLVLTANVCLAQERSPGELPKWDFSAWVAGATGEEHTNSFAEAQIVSSGFFIGKPVTGEIGGGWNAGSLEFGVNIIPILVQFRPAQIHGVGIEPVVLRYNSRLHLGRGMPYIELAGGGLRTNGNFPTGNTSNFNFTARGGGGIQFFTSGHRSIDLGCRWSHISNANLGDVNPEFNGIQLSVGFHWFK